MTLGIIGRPQQTGDPDERALREARVAVARRNQQWQEIPDDLVPGGRCLVGLDGRDLFGPSRRRVGVRQSRPDRRPGRALVFTVSDDGELRFLARQPGAWSEVVARRSRRGRTAA